MTRADRLPPWLRAAADPLLRQRAIRKYRTGLLRNSYPASPDELRSSRLFEARWYYSAELLPGVITVGQFAPEMPMLPRLLLRHCDVAGMSCLDIGTMEGLVPTLLAKRHAREVLAVDHSSHALGRLAAVKHYHGVEFEYRNVGLMYRLHEQLRGGYDLVNLSGFLYHVFSPLGVLAAIRPLVKRGGLVVVSTNVTLDPDYVMDFNAEGRMQAEANTFWYPSARLLDYMLRYMRLTPVDCAFYPHSELGGGFTFDKPSGYVSVVCRAVDDADRDDWMRDSTRTSWEYHGLSDWRRAEAQPRSTIRYMGGNAALDLAESLASRPPTGIPADVDDSHVLRLAATS
jgi:2-polyprenyl-3-methyl-5-hydroxy-6-metoxy-1,4-benzoquinol methylase